MVLVVAYDVLFPSTVKIVACDPFFRDTRRDRDHRDSVGVLLEHGTPLGQRAGVQPGLQPIIESRKARGRDS
jgi:hypothetical protein